MTPLLQLVNKLATGLLRTHLADKLWDFYVCITRVRRSLQLILSTLFIADQAPVTRSVVIRSLPDWNYLSYFNSAYMYFQGYISKAYTFRETNNTLHPLIGVCLMAQVTYPTQKLFLVPVEFCSSGVNSTRLGVRVVPSLLYNPRCSKITDNTGMCLGMDSNNTAFLSSLSSCGYFAVINYPIKRGMHCIIHNRQHAC
jgi:hypothetical protein